MNAVLMYTLCMQQGAVQEPTPEMEPMALHPPVTVMKERAKRLNRNYKQICSSAEEQWQDEKKNQDENK